MSKVLVLGAAGFVGSAFVEVARAAGDDVVASGRCVSPEVYAVTATHAELESLFARHRNAPFDQIVMLVQLGRDDARWMVEWVDGPRWVVMSSAQLNNTVASPSAELARANELIAIERGAVVLRPTMIYGRGRDHNLSQLTRRAKQFGVLPAIARGATMVQPIYVDDVVAAIRAVRGSEAGGCFEIGGAEAVTTAELITDIGEVLGRRVRQASLPRRLVTAAAQAAPAIGLRRDQILRLLEDKTVDNTAFSRQFAWAPVAHAVRLEQAIAEAA